MTPLLELDAASKRYGATQALDGVSFAVRPGEVHALVGENGAGKSTALGLMYGVVQPDSGEVRVSGRPVRLDSPAAAQAAGVGCVFQELSLAGALSAAENVFAGRPPSRFGLIDRRAMRERAAALLAGFGARIDVDRPVDRLTAGERQLVEIAKALALESRVLLFDEPTSALTPDEVEALFGVIRGLTGRGVGVVYVSHHLREVLRIADRVTVLRDGRHVATHAAAGLDEARLVADMIGRAPDRAAGRARPEAGRNVLAAVGITGPGRFADVTLSIGSGEILGLAGLMGSRAGAVARALAGLEPLVAGRIEVEGAPVRLTSLRDAMAVGIGLVPDERKTEGLFLDFSIADNLTAATMSRHARWGVMRAASARAAASRAIARFSVRAAGPEVAVGGLSGGNQQKVMLAKWLETGPRALIVNEPTKGVDVGAKAQIHEALRAAAAQGMAILVVSSDFPELLGLAHRVLVVREGRIVGEAPSAATEDDLIALAAGGPLRASA